MSNKKRFSAYKYKSIRDLSHCLDIINNRRLYCARWQDLNDPMEGTFRAIEQANYEEAIQQRVNLILAEKPKYRICALSREPRNQAMLSYYCDNHRGAIFEIELTESESIFDVEYVAEYPELDVLQGRVKDIAQRIFTYKQADWSHEREVRIIFEKEFYHFQINVKSVRFGSQVDTAQAKPIVDACAEHQIAVHWGH